MIKLIAEYFQPEYVSPCFRFYMREDCDRDTIVLFCLIPKDISRDSSGKDFFVNGDILKYIKDIGLKCEIVVKTKHKNSLNHFLNEYYISNAAFAEPEEFFTFKF